MQKCRHEYPIKLPYAGAYEMSLVGTPANASRLFVRRNRQMSFIACHQVHGVKYIVPKETGHRATSMMSLLAGNSKVSVNFTLQRQLLEEKRFFSRLTVAAT